MKKIFTYAAPALTLLGLALGGCQVDIAEPKASAGNANFSQFLAVGNSLTAGFSDGAGAGVGGLSLEGQLNSYPNIMAEQFRLVGGGTFNQPLFNSAGQFNGTGFVTLTGFSATGSPLLSFESRNLAVIPGSLTTKRNLLAKYTGPVNHNLGVPGIKVNDITINGYGLNNPVDFNPYFERLLPTGAGGGANYLQYVQQQVATVKPTFFSCWLGNNDVLGYATSGGDGTELLTSMADFTPKYNAMVDALTAAGAKGVLADVPNVTSLPYFTTVPAATFAGVAATPIPPALAAVLATRLGIPALPAGSRLGLFINALTATGTTAVREATGRDILLLPAASVINVVTAPNPLPGGIGVIVPGIPAAVQAQLINPLSTTLVLDEREAANVATRTTQINAVIFAAAQRKDLAIFGANAFLAQIVSGGLAINGTNNTSAYITGNLFSLDGVHPTPRGYAVIANEILKSINVKYDARVPGVDATRYRGVKFP